MRTRHTLWFRVNIGDLVHRLTSQILRHNNGDVYDTIQSSPQSVTSECSDNDIHNSIAAGYSYNLLSMIVPLNRKLCTQHAKKLEVGKGGGATHIRRERGKNCRSIIYN